MAASSGSKPSHQEEASTRQAVQRRWHTSPATLIVANLLSSLGGGRVLSAVKGVTGIKVLGSGSILAFLAGSTVGLLLLMATRRRHPGITVSNLSLLTVLIPLALLAILSNSATPVLHGAVSWLFFAILVLRCALWFAGRSLRSGIAASTNLAWLGITEASYFTGFIGGLMLAPVLAGLYASTPAALLMDAVLLAVVAACDASHRRLPDAQPSPVAPAADETAQALPQPLPQPDTSPAAQTGRRSGPTFWALAGAFGLSTLAVQVVIMHLADTLFQQGGPFAAAWADTALAAFYAGVAACAAICSYRRPVLEHAPAGRTLIVLRGVTFRGNSRDVSIPLWSVALTCCVLVVSGVASAWLNGPDVSPWSWSGMLPLALLTAGSAVFELFVLAIMTRISASGQGSVAIALGSAASASTTAMFLMMLGGVRLSGWIAISVLSIPLSVYLVRR